MDTFEDGTPSIISVKRPKGHGWSEIPSNKKASLGFPCRAFYFQQRGLAVISAVEVVADGKVDKGPEFHISISKQLGQGSERCSSDEAKWVLKQFDLEEAEEDNHVPSGKVRNFWRPVADKFVGFECECKEDEPAMIEDKGDFIWRGISD